MTANHDFDLAYRFTPKAPFDPRTLETMPYTGIVGIANDRVVTARDFALFIGQRQWMVTEGDWYGDGQDADGDVAEFFIRDVDYKNDKVLVGLLYRTFGMTGIGYSWIDMWIDADELVIRIEAS